MKALLALAILIPQFVMASALVIRDSEKRELKIVAKLHYFGEAVTEQIAAASTQEIVRMWNEPQGKVLIYASEPGSKKDKPTEEYRLVFDIDYVVHKEKPVTSKSCVNNFIEVKNPIPKAKDNYSYWLGTGEQTATFFTNDKLGESTTAAHEFGHGLGLDHPENFDQRNLKEPGIMLARGTIVPREFQIDPKLNPDEIGWQGKRDYRSRLNPFLRKVTQLDIKNLGVLLEKKFIDGGLVNCLGTGSPILND